MSERDYNRYRNVLEFIRDWQHFETKHAEMRYDDFRKQMQSFHYINFDCYDNKYEQPVNIILFSDNNAYVQNNADMKKLLSKIIKPNQKHRIILITKEPLSIYHKKSIAKEKVAIIDAYRHEIFDFVVPKSNASALHRILSNEEILNITNNELFCNVVNLPKILDTDPQCIWIGAKPGDVLEITLNTEISGNCIRYHLVIPHTGRFTDKNISKELMRNAKLNFEKNRKQKLDPIEQKQKDLISKKENFRGILAKQLDEDSDAAPDNESDEDQDIKDAENSDAENSDDSESQKQDESDNELEHSNEPSDISDVESDNSAEESEEDELD